MEEWIEHLDDSDKSKLTEFFGPSYVPIGLAAKLCGVHPDTIRNWETQNKITSTRTDGGHRRYLMSDCLKLAKSVRKNTQTQIDQLDFVIGVLHDIKTQLIAKATK